MRKSIIAAILALSFSCFIDSALANVTTTPATGGGNISADKAANAVSPAWTSLGQIIIDEVNNGNKTDFASGTGVILVLKAPAGFEFNTGVTPNITFTSGRDISAASITFSNSTTLAVTLTITGTGNVDKLTIGSTTGLQVRPLTGTPLVSGQIYRPSSGGGSANIAGITATSNTNGAGGTSFGSLAEIAGAANKLAFTTQPGSATAGQEFGIQPVIKSQDQFGNLSTSSLPASLNVTNTLTSGTGVLSGKTFFDIGTSAGQGTVTFTNLQISLPGTNKQLTASATGLISAVSQQFSVNGLPSISSITNQVTNEDTPTAAIPFTVSDLETPAANLILSASSSNTDLVPNANLVFGGSGTNRTLTITPATNQFGTNTITIFVSDGIATNSTSFLLTVNSANDAPALNAISDLIINEDSGSNTVNLAGISSGATNEIQVLTITATSSNPSLIPDPTVTYTSPSANGSIRFAPLTNAFGSATITVKIQDNGGTNFGGNDSFTETFLVTVNPVNDVPTLNAINNLTINEDSGTNIVNLSGISSGTINETQILTVTATSSNPSLIPDPTVIYTSPNTNGSIRFASLTNAFGSATITVRVQDNGGTNFGGIDSVTRTFLFTVNSVNDAPTLTPINDLNINEDSGTNIVNLSGISSGATNETQILTVTATSSNPALIPNPTVTYTSPNINGSISFTPLTNAFGSATITVRVQDNGGTNLGGVDFLVETFLVTVNPLNEVPTLSPINNLTINEESALQTITLSNITSGATNEIQVLTVTATSSNPSLIPDPTVNYTSPNTNGSISFTPLTNAFGSATISVKVQDNGGTNFGGADSITRTFLVTMNPINDAPTLTAINDLTINEDAPLQTISLSNITSGVTNEIQVLTVTATSSNPSLIPNPTINYTSPNTTGSIAFAPLTNVFGSATITVKVQDNGGTNSGGLDSVTRTFLVTVNSANDAPTLTAINDLSINEDATQQTINLSNITSGAANESQSRTVTATSSNPSLIPDPTVNYTSPNPNGSINFTPLPNIFGSATITVKVQDDGGTNFGGVDSVTRTFLVTVNPVNDVPTLDALSPLTIDVNSGTQIIPLSGIASGATNEIQTLTVTATSSNLALIPNPTVTYTSPNTNGSISFTPLTNASGSATINVRVQDNGGTNFGGVDSVLRQFVVTVTPRTDLMISQTVSPNPASLGGDISFLLTVSNRGPSTADNVVITNNFPAGMAFVLATLSQGSFNNNGAAVICNLGSITNRGIATANIVLASPPTAGTVTNIASVTTSTSEPITTNNLSSATATIIPPNFVFQAGTLSVETCVNGAVDPAEAVTMNFSLKNTGTANTTNLVATLKNSGGVTTAGAPQNFGVLNTNGTVVSRPFTFTPIGSCGGNFTATLQLQDGSVSLGSVSFNFSFGVSVSNTTFVTKTNSISIPFGAASPYPSTNIVSGLLGPILKVAVRFNNLTHGQPDDLDILLVGPNGESTYLMSDCGGASALNNVTFTLDDSAANALPDSAQITNGTYKPSNFAAGIDPFSAPAPAGPYITNLSGFNGGSPNGEWQLFVMDDFSSFSGSMAGGWTLILTTLEPSCCVPTNSVNLALSVSDSPDPVIVGNDLVYTIFVTNFGPATATGVTVTNPLPQGVSFVSAVPSQGTATNSNGTVICNLGTLASNATANVTLTVRPVSAGITITNLTTVRANQPEYAAADNSVVTLTDVSVPTISIGTAAVVEGTTNAVFNLVLSSDSSQTISVNYATADDTTTAGSDYFSTNGIVTFAPGQTNKTVTVGIKGDLLNEATEFFFLNLSNPVNVTIAEGQGVGMITDDDPLPSLAISDATITEGNSGTTNINFVVSLVPVNGQTVTVNYSTANGSAVAGADYESATGTITFDPGQTNQVISIVVKNELTNELTETFFVNLTNQVNTSLSDAQGLGTILNDDLFANIATAGFALTAENCAPTNGLIDPNETVTVNFSLRNVSTGTAKTTNLVATLLPVGGVTSPSAAQNYGALSNTGPAVARSFTFGVSGSCGSTIAAVFQLQDGTNNLGTVTNFLLLGKFSLETNSFTDLSGIAIADFGGAAPYPAVINVSGITGGVTQVTITLTNLSHTYPSDLDILLVGPNGENVLLMSDTGLGGGISNVTLTFDDTATNSLSEAGQIISGRFKPTNIGENEIFSAPAPGEPYGTLLSAFNGMNPNGAWSLYVYDDTGGDAGTLGGWKLTLTSFSEAICCGVNSSADLAVSISDSPDPVTVGSNVVFTIAVTNRGPYAASGVSLMDPLPAGANFVSATSTLGSCTNLGGTVLCDLGSMTNGANATITLTVTTTVPGTMTNSVSVFSNTTDPVSTNDNAVALTTVRSIVGLSVTDANASEAGPDTGIFTVTRTGTVGALTVNYTVAGTASTNDYATLSGSVIISNGVSSAQIVLTPVDDFLVESTETVILNLAASALYTINSSSNTATANITDNDGQNILLSTNALAVLEGDTNNFTVRLTAQPTNTVTVTTTFTGGDTNLIVSSGASINFTAANWNIPQPTAILATQDVDIVNSAATFTVSSAGLGSQIVTVTEIDDDVVAIVASTNLVSVFEGSTNSFTVQLSAQPTNAVTVTTVRTSGETNLNIFSGASRSFTTNNWNVPQTIVLNDGMDLNAFNGQAIFTLSSTNLANVTVTAVEIENDQQLIVLSTNSLTIAEGATNTFTVRLSAQPTSAVVVATAFTSGDTNLSVALGTNLTFNSTNWDIVQAVGIRATMDNDVVNGQATFTISAAGWTNQILTATEADNDVLDFILSTNSVAVSEGGTNTFNVRLTAQPSTNVIVNTVRAAGDTNLTVTSGFTLTFDSVNWNTPQNVALTASQDNDVVNGQATFIVSSSGLANQFVTATEIEDDTLNIISSTNLINVPEGDTNSFTVRLSAQPTNNVTISISRSGDTNLNILGATNFFFDSTNWNVAQVVIVSASEDNDAINGQGTFLLSSAGLSNVSVVAIEVENDTQSLLLSTNLVSVLEGSSNSFTLRLTAEPTNSVAVNIVRSSGDTNLNLASSATLTFNATNWNLPQTVSLAATQDDDAVNGQAIFTVSSTGLTSATVTAFEIENDTLILIASTNSLTVPEGATNTFTIRLSAQPTGNVVVATSFTSGDTNLIVASGSSLTFNLTNWNVPQLVGIRATEDNDAVNSQATFTISASGFTNLTLVATESDNDLLNFILSTNALAVAEGGTNIFTVRLTAEPTNNVVVNTARSSGDTNLNVASGSALTFNSTNWNVTQNVSLSASQDNDVVNGVASFTVSSSGLTNQFVTATEIDNDTLNLILSTNVIEIPEGTTVEVEVRLSAQPANTVTVTLTNFGDSSFVILGGTEFFFNSTDWSVPQTVVLGAFEDLDAVNGQGTFVFSSAGLTNVSVTATEIENDTQNILVSDEFISVPEGSSNSFTLRLTAQPTNSVSVNIVKSPGDTNLSLTSAATLLFNSTNWNFQQTVWLSATEDDDAINGQADFVISSPGLTDQILPATEIENDVLSVQVTNSVFVIEGSTNIFSVRLTAQPTNAVNVAIAFSGDSDINLLSASNLFFSTTNWSVPQSVIISAAEDADALNGHATLFFSAAGFGDQIVTATEIDNDVGIVVSTNLLMVAESQSNVFTVRLNVPPDDEVPVTISFVQSDPDISISTNTFVFNSNNWDIVQTVTASAAEDNDNTNGQATLSITSPGLTEQNITFIEIDNDMQSRVLCPGENGFFQMTGTGPFVYAWFQNGSVIVGETNNSLAISNVTFLDAGTYSVIFTNGAQAITNSATLTVSTNTSATALTSLIECPGDNVSFSTTPSGTGPFSFVWRKDGIALSNQTNASLNLLSVVATNAGTYSVIVSGSCNSVTNSATLTVSTNTSATALTSMIHCPGDNVSFSTTPSGTGPFTFLWRKDGIVLSNQTNATLNLLSVVATNAGTYSVIVSGSCNSVTNSATLTISTNTSATALTSLIECPGDNVSFSTTPSGTGPFSFVWRKDGIVLNNQTNATLNLLSVVATNAATYSVEVSGSCNSVTNSATLIVNTNTSAAALTNLVRCPGDNATFSTTPSGTGPFTFAWRKNGSVIANQTNSSLIFVSVVATNAGAYAVEVSGNCNSVTNSATLVVNTNTSATTLVNLIRCPGDNATFSTTPTGTGPFTFAWRKNGVIIPNQTNNSLSLISVVATNAGTYAVEVSGNCNSVTNSATLVVNTNTSATTLTSLVQCPGDSAVFSTTPSGTGPFTFVWRQNGIVLVNQTNASLNLLSVNATNAGTYSVEVSGNCNSVTNSATLVVNTNTSATTLANLIRCPGDTATFSTTPGGTGPFTFVWRKNGVVIENETNSSLNLLSVIATDAGTYAVEVSGDCNSVTNLATLVVNTNTSATALTNLVRCPGDAAVFSTTPSGTGPFAFIWRKNGAVIANQTNSSLSFPSVVATNAGTYAVEVSGNCNSITNSATLVVNTDTSATALANLVRCPGDTAIFSTTPSGTGPFTFVWRKDGAVLANQTNSSLNLISLVATNTGTYSVEVSGDCNSVTNSASLTINTNTSATALTSLVKCPGNSATFSTTPSGTGPFTFVWRKNGVVITDQTNNSITFPSVVATNAGTYSVQVSGNCNSVTNSASLTVNTNTSATALTSLTRCPGENANFSTTPSGTGPFTFVWRKNGSVIANQTNSSLIFISVVATNAGTYAVEVSGNCNSVTNSATLVVNTNTSATTLANLIRCPGDTATFSTTPSGTGPFTFVWRKNGIVIANETNSSLNLLSVIATDAGTYAVEVSGDCNSVTNLATLVVNANTSATALTNLVHCPGDAAVFSTTPSGTGPFSYVWRKDGIVIENQTNATLNLISVVATNAGNYSVEVLGDCNSVTNSASLVVNTNTSASALTSLIRCPGENATFSTTPSGTGPFSFVWRKEGIVLINQTNSSLNLISVVATNAGNYSVEVSGDCTGVTNSASLVVNMNTSASALTSLIRCPSENAAFSTTPSGTGPFSFVWRKDSIALSNQTNATLNLLSVVATNAGTYSVIVSGSCNSVTNSATLTVNSITAITPLLGATNFVGEMVTFTTAASGTGPFSYVWKHEGTSIPGETNSTLTFTSVSTANAGTYVVEVSGACGMASSSATLAVLERTPQITVISFSGADVIINFRTKTGKFYRVESIDALGIGTGLGPPWRMIAQNIGGTGGIVQTTDVGGAGKPSRFYRIRELNIAATTPADLIKCPGDSATFTTIPSGTGPFTFVWRKDGIVLSNQTNASVNLISVAATNAGLYAVEVSGGGDSLTNSAALTVNTNTSASALTSLVKCPGDSGTFSTTPSGTGPFTFIWRKDGIVLSNQTNAALNLLSVVATNAGNYSVEVSGNCNSVTNSASLIVNTNTSATALTSLVKCPGDSATFVTTTSGTGPFTFVWRHNGIALANQTNATLNLLSLVATNAGNYSVEVSGSCNSVTNSASLTVNTNTSASLLTSLVRCPGDSATFSTTPSGTGPFSFVWRKDGISLGSQTNSSLSLISLVATNAGTYSVIVSGSCNSVTNFATLTINSPTTITPLANATNFPGDTVIFNTSASGTGPFSYIWKKDGVAISGETNNTLTISPVSNASAGTYTIEVTGACGTVTSSATLTVAAQIPQISAITISGNDVLINFSTRVGKFYRVEYVDDLSANIWKTVADNIPGTGGIVQAVDFGGAGKPSRFYRVREFDSITYPQLTSLAFTNGDVIISFNTVAGSYYRVERTDELGSNLWTPVVDVVVGTGGIMSVTDVGGAGRSHRFYRVLLLSNGYVQSLIVSTNRLTIGEGSTTNFTVRLAIAPTTNVLVTTARSSGDSDLVVSAGNTLTFTPSNWATPQTISLHANADADLSNGQATFAVSSGGLANQFVTATEADNNSQIQIRITSLSFTNNDVVISFDTTAGSYYRVERTDDLGSNLWTPVVDVVIGTGGIISVKDIGGAGRPHRFYRVRLLSSGSVQTLIISTNQLTVAEGSTTNFTVRLAIAPTTNVLVTTARRSGDSDLIVSGGSALTFTPLNWNTPQPVSLHANTDPDILNGQATFAISSSGLADQFVFAMEADNLQTEELRIMAIQLVGTNAVVSFNSVSGTFYSLEYAVGLGSPWLTATNNITGSGGVMQATDRGGATQARRFYRVKQLP